MCPFDKRLLTSVFWNSGVHTILDPVRVKRIAIDGEDAIRHRHAESGPNDEAENDTNSRGKICCASPMDTTPSKRTVVRKERMIIIQAFTHAGDGKM
jgi:hypothetical protein